MRHAIEAAIIDTTRADIPTERPWIVRLWTSSKSMNHVAIGIQPLAQCGTDES